MKMKVRIPSFKIGSKEIKDIVELDFDVNGKGSEDDPIIIDSANNFPKDFEVMESNLFIKFKNCDFISVSIHYSRYMEFENCHFESIWLFYCSEIIIKNSQIGAYTHLLGVHDCIFENLSIGEFGSLFKCNNNKFENCELLHFNTYLSRDNTFTNTEIELNDIQIIKEIENTFTIYDQRRIDYEIDCLGTGTINDPIIIDNGNVYSKTFYFYKNRHFVILKNINIDNLIIFDSKHMKIKNCELKKSFEINYSSDLEIQNISSKKLIFGNCTNVTINLSNFEVIDMFKKSNGEVRLENCKVNNVKKEVMEKINSVQSEFIKIK